MTEINTFNFMENQRKSYQSPVVEIISWEVQDVITTSGITHVTTVTPQMGDDNYTCTYDMDSGR